MILLIDNYDSFTYNLYQQIGVMDPNIVVVRNDERTVDELVAMRPDALVISPGPGKPADAGVSEDAIRAFAGSIPILGVCLGHQAICEVYGSRIVHARHLMHGKSSIISTDPGSRLFAGMPRQMRVGRYHSLVAEPVNVPAALRVSARTLPDAPADQTAPTHGVPVSSGVKPGEVMAVEHREFPIFGVQFHPESILTPLGASVTRRFLAIANLVPEHTPETGRVHTSQQSPIKSSTRSIHV